MLLRRLCLLLTFCFVWSFVAAPWAWAVGDTQAQRHHWAAPKPLPRPTSLADMPFPLPPGMKPASSQAVRATTATAHTPLPRMAHMPPQMLRPNLVPLTPQQRARLMSRAAAPGATTLLGMVAKLTRPVSTIEAAGWARELQSQPAPPRAAQLHLWLGEWQLADNEQPENAAVHFDQARTLAHALASQPSRKQQALALYGLAAYDGALALFYEGAYQDAALAFRGLMLSHAGGYDRRLCALWSRHANACAGYHAQRAALGIPEPPRLDPLCGAAALASSLRALGRPYDRKSVLSAVRVTGEGSDLSDVLAGARKLGMNARAVTADDLGLMALPKPVVATAEHDHFISVVGAGRDGVSYICSDCGPWPGGAVHVTWRQWHALEPTVYVAVTRPGSSDDQALASLGSGPPSPLRIGFTGLLSSLRLGQQARLALASSLLRGHVVLTQQTGGSSCGSKPTAPPCPCIICCIMAAGGPGGFGGGGGAGGGGNGPHPGAISGDPVNLATLEEEYSPGADLTVYNPVGPSVSWSREYRSLRGPGQNGQHLQDVTYQSDDFGVGWSQGYNIGVTNPNAYIPPAQGPTQPTFTAGTTGPVTAITRGTDYVSHDLWYVYMSTSQGTLLVGTSDTTQGSPNGWSMVPSGSNFSLTVPSSAAGGSYYWEYISSSASVASEAPFYAEPSAPTTGAKGIIFPNGSQITFSAPAIPNSTATSAPTTTASARVACTVEQGAPFLVEWDYDSSTPWGHFVITMADRSKWVTAPASATLNQYCLSQIVDHNGNAITFHYGAAATTTASTHWPLLSSITNSAGTTLLSVTRAGDGTGNITAITDCYGRSVYYHEGAYACANVPYDWTQSYQEVDHVSQIVPTGTASPADRWSLGYQGVSNGEAGTGNGGESIPFLHTMTVPSAAGPTPGSASLTVGEAGTATASINYSASTDLVSSVVDANGNTMTFTSCSASGAASYPSNYTQVAYTNAAGAQVYSSIFGFNSAMSGTSETDSAGNALQTNVYGDAHDPYRPSSVTDGNGKMASYTWDQYGNMVTATPPSNSSRTPAATTNTYSYAKFALGELTSTQTGSKSSTTYIYDDQAVTGGYLGSGMVTSVTAPLPGTVGSTSTVTTTYTYDLTTYSSSGAVTYQGLGNLLSVTTPGNNAVSAITTTFNYTTDGSYTQSAALGQPITITDDLGNVTHMRYDARGNMLSNIDAFGNESDYTYNIANQKLETLSPATGQQGSGHSESLNAYLYPDGPLTSTSVYDESGTQIRQVAYTYGPEGETRGVSGSTEPVTYTYDALYRLNTLTDGNSHTTHYYYKQQQTGALDAVTYPGYAGSTPVYSSSTDDYSNVSGADSLHMPTYDNDGNMLTRIDGNGVTTTYTHSADPESLLTDIHYTYPNGYTGTQIADVSYTYDSYGRRLGMTDGTGSQSYSYDDRDALLSHTTTYTGLSAMTLAYSFWPDGSRAGMSTPAGSFSYAYDGDGRMTGLTNPYSETTNWSYLANSWLWKQTLGNGVVTADTYNALGEVTDLQAKNSSGTTLSDFNTMSYDGAQDRLGMTASIPSGPNYTSGTTAFQYDAGQTANPALNRSQLTREQSTRNGGDNYTYGYDTAGNATTLRNTAHSYNADNQRSDFTYDGNGNPTGYGGQSPKFDPENRMTVYASSEGSAYNGDGLRAIRRTAANMSASYYFLYDGDQTVIELNSNGTLNAVNTFGANGLVSRRTGGATAFYTFDPSGNVCQRLTSTGAVSSTDVYEAFGQPHALTSDPWEWGAQWGYYTDTGGFDLVLCGHRWYDPGAGRWFTRDPISYLGGINLYAYTQNNPVNWIDATGLYSTIPIEFKEDCEARCEENLLIDSATCHKISNMLDRVRCYLEEQEKFVKCTLNCRDLPPRPCPEPDPEPIWPWPDPWPDYPPGRVNKPIWPIWPIIPLPLPLPL